MTHHLEDQLEYRPLSLFLSPACDSVLIIIVTVWSFEFQSYAGLQIHFRTFDTGFICASAIGYYISNPILEVERQESFIFRHGRRHSTVYATSKSDVLSIDRTLL
jgi:hypothetical protein